MAKKRRARVRTKSVKSKRPSETLRVAITFPKPAGGPGPKSYAGRIAAGHAAEFAPEERTVCAALTNLENMGFKVTNRGRLTASVRCSRKDYERVFGTELAVFKTEPLKGGRVPAKQFYFPPQGARWAPSEAVISLIDDAYIQWPHIYCNQRFPAGAPQPIPPQVDYHHLRVPGDVVLTMNAAEVHRRGFTGNGIRVAMIDSGFAHSHQYFQEMDYNTTTVLAPGATDLHLDGNGHGTGESANLLAIAPDCTFIGVKLDNETDPESGASLLEGFQEALRHNPQVISVSLVFDLADRFQGGRHLTQLPSSLVALEAEIQAAIDSGIVVVFSAGNGHVGWPGMMPSVIAVGGVYVDTDGSMQASDYASAFRSLIYPGRFVPDCCGLVGLAENDADYIMLPIPPDCEIDRENAAHDGTDKTDGWGVFSGTSAAAPQLAGACALLLQANPGLSPGDVQAVLRRSARDVTQGQANAASNEGLALQAGPGTDSATGAGLVDALAALQQV